MKDGKTEFIDLELPSRTLWSADFEKINNSEVLYLPYCEASKYSIPTLEQWLELSNQCKWVLETHQHNYRCLGPNGNILNFYEYGHCGSTAICSQNSSDFWVKDEGNDPNIRKAAHVNYYGKLDLETCDFFVGYKLPLRLVHP